MVRELPASVSSKQCADSSAVEQGSLKPKVVGSIPSRHTRTRPLTLKQTRVMVNDSFLSCRNNGKRLNNHPLPNCDSVRCNYAYVAQLVEQCAEDARVSGSIPFIGTISF